jgi:hypothetical protein
MYALDSEQVRQVTTGGVRCGIKNAELSLRRRPAVAGIKNGAERIGGPLRGASPRLSVFICEFGQRLPPAPTRRIYARHSMHAGQRVAISF